MGILFDIIIAFLVIFCAIVGWKKGIFRALMRLVIVVVSTIGALFLTPLVSTFLCNNFIEPKIAGHIFDSFQKVSCGKSLDLLFKDFPNSFTKWLSSYTSVDRASEWFSKNPDATEKGFSNFVASPIARTVSKVIAFVLLFIILLIILRIICFFIEKLLKLPVLNGINKTLGLCFGILMGIGISLILCACARAGIPEFSKVHPLANDVLDNSVFLNLLTKINLLSFINIFNI